MSPPWKKSKKKIIRNRHQEHISKQSLPSFNPPSSKSSFLFNPNSLYASMAKCNAISTVSKRVRNSLTRLAEAAISEFVDENEKDFKILDEAKFLGDARLSNLSHDVGIGVANLYMQQLGFKWLANGEELLAGYGKKPDYIYDTGNGTSDVVVMEAKGGIGKSVTIDQVNKRAENGYRDQADIWLGKSTSIGNRIVHGYAVGTCATAGGGPGEYVVHETKSKTSAQGKKLGNSPSAAIALANYFAVFSLMRAPGLEDYIALLHDPDFQTTRSLVTFDVCDFHGVKLMMVRNRHRPYKRFAIDMNVGEWFLENINSEFLFQREVNIPSLGEAAIAMQDEMSNFVVFPDGLIFIRDLKNELKIIDNLSWSAQRGLH
jgi:hypothetical protein